VAASKQVSQRLAVEAAAKLASYGLPAGLSMRFSIPILLGAWRALGDNVDAYEF
jgi:hypothetical protein